MSSFIREYVFVQSIPIVKLLFAFGICLVCRILTDFPPYLCINIPHSVQNLETSVERRYCFFLGWRYQESEWNADVLAKPLD